MTNEQFPTQASKENPQHKENSLFIITELDQKSAEQLLLYAKKLEEVQILFHANPEEWLKDGPLYHPSNEKEKSVFEWYRRNKYANAYLSVLSQYAEMVFYVLENTPLAQSPTLQSFKKYITLLEEKNTLIRKTNNATSFDVTKDTEILASAISEFLKPFASEETKEQWTRDAETSTQKHLENLLHMQNLFLNDDPVSEAFREPLAISIKAIAEEIEKLKRQLTPTS